MFTLTFNTDTDAFQDGNRDEEIIHILTIVGNRIASLGDTKGVVKDTNGNTIGDWVLE